MATSVSPTGIPQMPNPPTWEWAAEMADFWAATRGNGADLGDQIRLLWIEGGLSPDSHDDWLLLGEFTAREYPEDKGFTGSYSLGRAYATAGAVTDDYQRWAEAQSWWTMVKGTAQGSVETVAKAATVAGEAAEQLAKNPFGTGTLLVGLLFGGALLLRGRG